MIFLTFDLEEFDLPTEFGNQISFEDQLSLSAIGARKILSLLKEKNVKATFFVTVVFALNNRSIIEDIVADGHEIGSHGWSHSGFEQSDPLRSRLELENITGKKVYGFRMPRLQKVDEQLLLDAGYTYDSSLSPTCIPGRYNNLGKPILPHVKNGLRELPVSVTPFLKFPLFWLAFHLIPSSIFEFLSKWTLRKTGYLNLYFHPWEFLDKSILKKHGLPVYIQYNTGEKMTKRLGSLIKSLSPHALFLCCNDICESISGL